MLTMGAMIQWVGFNMLRIIAHLQRMALVSLLPTWFPACLLPQTARSRLFQTIAAGRLTTITAVLSQLVLQGLDGSCLLLHQRFQLLHTSKQNLN